jgi:hypothetical protein
LARAVAGHRGWAKDVDVARLRDRRALSAQAVDLRSDAARAPGTISGYGYPDLPQTSTTQVLTEAADVVMSRLARSHHLSRQLRSTAGLTSASGLAAELRRVTARPVDVRLGVWQNGEYDVWDLRTGRVRHSTVGFFAGEGVSGLLPRVGSSLLFQSEATTGLLSATAGPPIVLPRADGFYQAAGDEGIWRTNGTMVRRYDAQGRPVGRAYAYPSGWEIGPIAATSQALVVARNGPDAGTRTSVWFPATGRMMPITDACDAGVTAARATIAYVTCDQSHLSVTNVDSGHRTSIPLPSETEFVNSGPILSPDGARVAILLQKRAASDAGQYRIAIYTLGHPDATVAIDEPGSPVTWSADGKVLLVDTSALDNETTSPPAPLAYWTDGMRELGAIRIDATSGSYAIGMLP